MSHRSPLRSAVYEGTVVHRRDQPARRFAYRLALPLVFLDELERLDTVHPLVRTGGHRRWAAVTFRRRDFLGPPWLPLEEAVRQTVRRAGGVADGPVAVLGMLRTWGWLFNPLTLYYCFDAEGSSVTSTVLEVTNTPWKERHAYVVGPPGRHRLRKELHVSPFLPTKGGYELDYGPPARRCRVRLAVSGITGPVRLSASMSLERRDWTTATLDRLVWQHALQPTRVSWRIYRQALHLVRVGAPFHAHPRRTPQGPFPYREETIRA